MKFKVVFNNITAISKKFDKFWIVRSTIENLHVTCNRKKVLRVKSCKLEGECENRGVAASALNSASGNWQRQSSGDKTFLDTQRQEPKLGTESGPETKQTPEALHNYWQEPRHPIT
ncbi:hypothetical protein J6590_048040 [Homalodisca vitripennis]|nr:hypothetical protein J6590_048040 [Homalodisca vitripennis]